MRSYRSLAVVAIAVGLAGCGGGGGGGDGFLTRALKVDVEWQALPRGPIALSGIVTVFNALPEGGDLVFTVNRGTGQPANTQTYEAPERVRTGTLDMKVKFFSERGGSGSLVQEARTPVVVPETDDARVTLALDPTVATIAIVAGQSVRVGQRADLAYTAHNAAGAVVAIPVGTTLVEVVGGQSFLQVVNGQVEGLASGTAQVKVTIAGITSPVQSVSVTSDTSVAVAPAAVTLNVGGTQTFTATVTNAADTSVTWSVQEGAAGGSVTSGGVYTAPNTAGTFHVIAASAFDSSKTGTATITVQSGAADIRIR